MLKEDGKQSITNKVKAKMDKAQRVFLVSNVLMTLLFAASSILKMLNDFTSSTLQFLTLGLLGAYVVAFIVLIVLFKKDKNSLKTNMKNYKFSIKVMKQVVNIMNLALALSVMMEAITEDSGFQQIFALIVAVIGIAMAVFKFILSVIKFILKKKRAKKKAAKKAARLEAQNMSRDVASEIAVGSDEEE